MTDIWLISDLHLGHDNILKFCGYDGTLLRPGFDDVNHMNEHIVECWNSVVKPQDKVYDLGDVIVKSENWQILKRLQGHKRLLLGNHDYPNMRLYAPYYEHIYSSRRIDKYLLTHIPVHPGSVERLIANIHGHVHANVPPLHFGPKYFNVSCEVLNFTPMHFDEVKEEIRKQQG